ncbi:MAG: CehA/McbA family metallohydrolase [Pirellulaceae bacterium]|nr:CehA/McbA family metallohydrolase [Pirellulaceae bacterium]
MYRQFSPTPISLLIGSLAVWLLANGQILLAHEGHQAATYEVTPSGHVEHGKYLRLKVVDAESSRPTAARFTLTVNGKEYIPPNVARHGLRFISIHQRRKQQFIATYARGSGDVLVPLPNDARSATVTVAKGFEFVPVTASFDINGPSATVQVEMERWVNLQAEGWHAADEHLHYERTDPKHDGDWLTMLDADGLSHAHFLVLRGGNLPGIWAQQFAYGKAGEANDGKRSIRPGEEYRDSSQGHINLLGVEKVISPISTGGIGEPRVPFNYPPLLDVFRRTHELGGIGGPAHGASLARSSTAALDTVLGQVDFFEIANTHLYKTDAWYQLLNCGFIVPPVAGTDLPNFGFRDPWQPLLGEVRTYVRSGARSGFDAWKQAVRRGEVFVTSGPVIHVDVDGAGPGGVVRLPPQGGDLTITAELASPRPLKTLEVVSMGQPISVEVKRTHTGGVHRLHVKQQMAITKSCWLAVRGTGGPKTAVEHGLGIQQDVMAHTGVVQVLVGNQPIRSEVEVERLRKQLALQQEHYRTQANYEELEHRLRFVDLFEQAIKRLD